MKAPAQTGKVDAGAAPTFALGQFAASLQGDSLPGDVKTTLGELFLDYIRVASIGAGMPWSAWSDAYMAHLGGHGRAAVLFQPQRRDPVRAAFLNATYAGSIDADDTHVGSMLHPGSIVFSAALALADEVGAGGKDFIAAVAAGYEAMIRIGLSIQPTHFGRGFQSTATCGGFGAAVAAARLAFNGQPHADRKIASSIGLVASQAKALDPIKDLLRLRVRQEHRAVVADVHKIMGAKRVPCFGNALGRGAHGMQAENDARRDLDLGGGGNRTHAQRLVLQYFRMGLEVLR